MNVESRVIRILRPLTQYHKHSTESLNASNRSQKVDLQIGEVYLGVYENIPDSLEDSITVTSLGLHTYRGGEWEFLNYEHIESIRIPSRKEEAAELEIHLYDGYTTRIPVRGGQGRFRDAFEFLRFLDRVRDDIRRRKQKKTE